MPANDHPQHERRAILDLPAKPSQQSLKLWLHGSHVVVSLKKENLQCSIGGNGFSMN